MGAGALFMGVALFVWTFNQGIPSDKKKTVPYLIACFLMTVGSIGLMAYAVIGGFKALFWQLTVGSLIVGIVAGYIAANTRALNRH